MQSRELIFSKSQRPCNEASRAGHWLVQTFVTETNKGKDGFAQYKNNLITAHTLPLPGTIWILNKLSWAVSFTAANEPGWFCRSNSVSLICMLRDRCSKVHTPVRTQKPQFCVAQVSLLRTAAWMRYSSGQFDLACEDYEWKHTAEKSPQTERGREWKAEREREKQTPDCLEGWTWAWYDPELLNNSAVTAETSFCLY